MATYTQFYIWLSLLGTESFIREVFHPEEAKVYMRAPFETKLPTAQISPPLSSVRQAVDYIRQRVVCGGDQIT